MILKSRKPGLSTVCIAYCGYVLRFRDRNARVHLFSRTERSALDLFAAVKFGLDSLPKWMQLPKERETLKQLEYVAGGQSSDIRKRSRTRRGCRPLDWQRPRSVASRPQDSPRQEQRRCR